MTAAAYSTRYPTAWAEVPPASSGEKSLTGASGIASGIGFVHPCVADGTCVACGCGLYQCRHPVTVDVKIRQDRRK